jgi:hypothetical protein
MKQAAESAKLIAKTTTAWRGDSHQRDATVVTRPTVLPTGLPTVPAPDPQANSAEQILHLSRRLDWRFLLPNPTLEQVAYFGPARSTLLSSLTQLATKVSIFSVSAAMSVSASQPHPQYQVVVVCDPTPQQLKAAVAFVQPGGSLYVEAQGLLWPQKWLHPRSFVALMQQPRLWQPADYCDALKGWAMREAEAFWFWPDFESCTKIVPLAEPVVLPYVFGTSSRPRGAKARVKAAYKRWLVHSGWLTLTLPSFAVVATKGAGDPKEQRTLA